MGNRLPMSLVLSRITDRPGSLQIIIDETAHLPKEKDFSSTVDIVRRAFRSSGVGEQVIAPQTRKLMTLSRDLLQDRENLRPVLKNARGVLSEWDEWLEVSESEGTEEELQECLETLAEAMSCLRDALEAYESEVLKKVTKK
jgi:hypothetical protein